MRRSDVIPRMLFEPSWKEGRFAAEFFSGTCSLLKSVFTPEGVPKEDPTSLPEVRKYVQCYCGARSAVGVLELSYPSLLPPCHPSPSSHPLSSLPPSLLLPPTPLLPPSMLSHLQVAFLGRSNVGKSSLINGLLGRKKLANTSSKPVSVGN